MRARRELVAFLVVLLLVGSHAAAEERADAAVAPNPFEGLSLSSRREPIQIDADTLELDYKGSTVTYEGNVKVTQGEVTLTSDRLVITYDAEDLGSATDRKSATPRRDEAAERIRQIVAEGRVRIQQEGRVAEGRRAVFDQAAQTLVLSDHAVLHEGKNQVSGDRIVVYLNEQRSVVESGSTSARVSAVLYPGSLSDKDDSPAKAGQ
jgi:lipopolysaccharide export system protein LptA